MTVAEFETALAKACPEDRKVVTTITSEWVTFSSMPRYKDSTDVAVREFPTTENEIAKGGKKHLDLAIASILPKPVTLHRQDSSRMGTKRGK